MDDYNSEEVEMRVESENEDNGDVNIISTDHLTYPDWKHGTAMTANKKKVRCNYCGKTLSGGIHRLKQHLAKLPGEAAICKKKSALKKMFVSEEWTGSKFAHLEEGREAEDIILDNYFWRKMDTAHKIIEPLVQALRMADGDDKPSMGYMYDAMERAKLKIAEVCGNDPRQYKDIWEIIDRRVEQKLHLALHLAGYYLNPSIRYRVDVLEDMDIRRGLQDVINVLEWDEDKKIDAIDEIKMFEDAAGMFGSQLAIASRARMSPVSWWESNGMDAPSLRRIAIRILSQTCSVSGCERNWSNFDQIYTKKRYQLKQKKVD